MSGGAEYELKARLPDDGRRLADRLQEHGWRRVFHGRMLDRRYDTPERSLERRDEVLRVRRYVDGSGGERVVLGWKGPASEEAGFKRREEIETEVGDGRPLVELLGRLGYTDVTWAIDRRVERYEKDGVHVRVERYPRMDTLAEIEGDPGAVQAVLEELGLPREAWKPWPLPRFVERFEERTGQEARLADLTGGENDG